VSIDPTVKIHPTAIVEDGATIGAGTTIGPYSIIGPEVVIGADNELMSHVIVTGVTTLGDRNRIWPFASVGSQPQDLKFAGERTELVIGSDNMIRESTSFNPGTEGGGGLTKIGNHNLFMLGTHVGHDCMVGDRIVLANSSGLAGHCIIDDGVIVGGLSATHQFIRMGRGSMVGGCSMARKDVIPFGTVIGEDTRLMGLNIVGLKRRGIEKGDLRTLLAAYRAIFESDEGTLLERAQATKDAYPENAYVQEITDFMLAESNRSFATP
jgi:UDP-N-acetylglucosamine acyltransferase